MESPAGLKIPVGLLHLVLLGSQQLQPRDSADDHDDADDLRRSQDFMIHKHAAEDTAYKRLQKRLVKLARAKRLRRLA